MPEDLEHLSPDEQQSMIKRRGTYAYACICVYDREARCTHMHMHMHIHFTCVLSLHAYPAPPLTPPYPAPLVPGAPSR